MLEIPAQSLAYKKACYILAQLIMRNRGNKSLKSTLCKKCPYSVGYSVPYFAALGLNTERYGVSLRIQSECEKIGTRKTPNTGTFYAVQLFIYHLV